ncbi:MAG: GNAT family protein [Pseudomonadota bacterium]
MPELTPIILETERLNLRWISDADAAAQFAIYSDPDVMRYWSSAPWTEPSQARANIDQAHEGYRNGSAMRLAVVRRDTGQLIGNVNLYAFFAQNRRCDVGYALARAHWGHGYLGEALAAALAYGFEALDLNRVEADIDPRNAASIKLLEKLGFQQEGYMRERWIVNGEVCDTVNYALLRRDWQAVQSAAGPA